MDESDPGIELRVTCQALFNARHSDQDHANVRGIEYGAHLFEARHPETVRLINDDQRRWIGKPHVSYVVLFGYLLSCRMKFRKRLDHPVVIVQNGSVMMFVSLTNRF